MLRGGGEARRSRRLGPAAVRLPVIAVSVVALVVAACGPTPSAGPTGSAGPEASGGGASTPPGAASSGSVATPAASAAAASPAPPSAPSLALQANVAVRITVASLNVRQWPSQSAKKVGAMAKDDVAVLLGYGGIKAGGYTWFEAARVKGVHGALPPLPADPTAGGSWTDLTGWIAALSGSTPYVATLAPRCSAAAATDLGLLSAMLPAEQLACLGKTPLVLQGTFGCGGCGGAWPGTFQPAWLATPSLNFLSVKVSQGIGPITLFFPPGRTPPAAGKIVSVHAHLGDDLSSTCAVKIPTTEAFDAPLVAIRPADAVLYCRQHLVVDSFDVIGVDPSFPPS